MDQRALELLQGRRIAALTGAGLSTDSGIPDYRGETGRRRGGNPMTYQEFRKSEDNRRHYWARSALGWSFMEGIRPNRGHIALADLERTGHVIGIITQNVDRLHHRAGSTSAIELHGRLEQVVCLECGRHEGRVDVQERMLMENPGWLDSHADLLADGDTNLDRTETSRFNAPRCVTCDGPLKPDVVFFGENVAKPVVNQAYQLVDDSEALLVLGSSLTVRSGLRFVDHAKAQAKPVVIVNQGQTRGDDVADAKIETGLSDWLTTLARTLS